MLAASFVSYIGAFNSSYRNHLWSNIWLADLKTREIPLTPNIDPMYILTNESQIATWQNELLPSDRMSTENGAIIMNCQRWPLLIDPQLQGIKWLKQHFKSDSIAVNNSNNISSSSGVQHKAGAVTNSTVTQVNPITGTRIQQLFVIQSGEKGWLAKIIQAIQDGDVVVLENVTESLDASLAPLLSKSLYKKVKSKLGKFSFSFSVNTRLISVFR